MWCVQLQHRVGGWMQTKKFGEPSGNVDGIVLERSIHFIRTGPIDRDCSMPDIVLTEGGKSLRGDLRLGD